MNLTLIRDYQGSDCIFGVLTVNGAAFQTIEKPWVPVPDALCGKPGASCVPAGTYALVCHDTEMHPKTWALVNPDLGVYHLTAPAGSDGLCRIACLIHPANFAFELEGCIAPGLVRSEVNGLRQVNCSRAAMGRIQELLPWVDGHILEIT